jgi:hypothetical protein
MRADAERMAEERAKELEAQAKASENADNSESPENSKPSENN